MSAVVFLLLFLLHLHAKELCGDEKVMRELRLFQAAYPGKMSSFGKIYQDSRSAFAEYVPDQGDSLKSMNARWDDYRSYYCSKLPQDLPELEAESARWGNTAEDLDSLHTLTESFKKPFEDFVREVATEVGPHRVVPFFGPGDAFMVKSKESMARKLAEPKKNGDGKTPDPEAPKKLGDALRGSLIGGDEDYNLQLSSVLDIIKRIAAKAEEKKWEIAWSNKFRKDYPSGYVGVHAKMFLKNTEAKTLIAELQVHFRSILDPVNTLSCPKEYTHHIYEITRLLDDKDKDDAQHIADGNAAQKLMFLFGMVQINPPQILTQVTCGDPKKKFLLEVGTKGTVITYISYEWELYRITEEIDPSFLEVSTNHTSSKKKKNRHHHLSPHSSSSPDTSFVEVGGGRKIKLEIFDPSADSGKGAYVDDPHTEDLYDLMIEGYELSEEAAKKLATALVAAASKKKSMLLESE